MIPMEKSQKKIRISGLNVVASSRSAAVDLVDSASGEGWHGLQFYLQTPLQKLLSGAVQQLRRRGNKLTWQARLSDDLVVNFDAQPAPTSRGILLKTSLTNQGRKPVHFTGYGMEITDKARGPWLQGRGLPVFAHSENLRYEVLPQSRPTFPFIRPIPESTRWFGRQGVGPMPVMVIGRLDGDRWLVEGAASQQRHAGSWQLGLPQADGRLAEYRSEFFWNGASQEQVAAGQTLELESNLYLIVNATVDRFYDAYINDLASLYGRRFAGTNSLLAHEPVYCSWNYGVYTNITQADCLKRIDIAAKAQRGGIFQLDHGYQPQHGIHTSWGYMDAYYPDTANTWDKVRFPDGPKRITETARQHGLVPAIWWTPRIDIGGPISQEHPEWIANDKHGQPIAHVGDLHPDYSVPQVREFIEHTIRKVIHEWGFGGIKLDFFSWAFEAPDVVYRHGGTSVQWRRWLIETVRRELGPKGYFLHCVSCPLGNPFLALDGCDSYRAGSDIDNGDWDHHVANSSWLLASITATGRRTWFADMDSFMGSPQYPANERRFRSAVGYLTGGMIDISGPLEKFDSQMLRDYRLLSRRCDQGGKVMVPDRTAFFGRPLPAVLARIHPRRSKTQQQFGILATVGLFNWQPVIQDVEVSLTELGLVRLPVWASSFWSGRELPIQDGVLRARLKPREHLLVDLSAR